MVERDSVSGECFDIRSRCSVLEEVPQVVVRIIFRHDPDDVRSIGGVGLFDKRWCKDENGNEECWPQGGESRGCCVHAANLLRKPSPGQTDQSRSILVQLSQMRDSVCGTS